MSLRTAIKFGPSLAFRLTLWYAGIFTISLFSAFLVFYFFVSAEFKNQTDDELLSRTRELESLFYVNGLDAVKRVAVLEAQAAGEKKIFVRLLTPNGTAFSSSNMSYWKNISVSTAAVKQLGSGVDAVFETVSITQRSHKVRVLYSLISRGVILQLGQSLEQQSRFFRAFQRIFILAMFFLVLSSAFIGWFMARRATSGVETITKTAQHISQGAMDQRVPVGTGGDEIARLAAAFNRMLDRIQDLVDNIREISDNIAHDLKGPVTRIRGLAEVTLTTAETLPEFKSMAAGTIEECDRLMDTINTMLLISRTESGVETVTREPIDLTALMQDACDLFGPMADDKGITLSCETGSPCPISGDLKKIQRMVANLIDNAVKYTPAGGSIRLSTEKGTDGFVTLTVSDTGIGISSKDVPHIFNRFFRADPSRSETGAGLGLSLARTVARAHGGDIVVRSRPGSGSTFIVSLPA